MNITDLIDLQLKHYNDHNLKEFLATYSDKIEIYDLGSDTPRYIGKKPLEKIYEKRFEVYKVHAEIQNRIVIGNKVIDHEHVTGLKENEIVRAVAVYEVENNLISKVWFILEENTDSHKNKLERIDSILEDMETIILESTKSDAMDILGGGLYSSKKSINISGDIKLKFDELKSIIDSFEENESIITIKQLTDYNIAIQYDINKLVFTLKTIRNIVHELK